MLIPEEASLVYINHENMLLPVVVAGGATTTGNWLSAFICLPTIINDNAHQIRKKAMCCHVHRDIKFFQHDIIAMSFLPYSSHDCKFRYWDSREPNKSWGYQSYEPDIFDNNSVTNDILEIMCGAIEQIAGQIAIEFEYVDIPEN